VTILDGSGSHVRPFLADTTEIDRMALSLEVVGAPADLLFTVVSDLVSPTDVKRRVLYTQQQRLRVDPAGHRALAGVVDVEAGSSRPSGDPRPFPRIQRRPACKSLRIRPCRRGAHRVRSGLRPDRCVGNDLAGWKLLTAAEAGFARSLRARTRGFTRACSSQSTRGSPAFNENEYLKGLSLERSRARPLYPPTTERRGIRVKESHEVRRILLIAQKHVVMGRNGQPGPELAGQLRRPPGM